MKNLYCNQIKIFINLKILEEDKNKIINLFFSNLKNMDK